MRESREQARGDEEGQMDWTKLDIYMLQCLQALVEEKHVTNASIRLDITQPRLSATLARLRKITGDELLVRSSGGMQPTEYAMGLYEYANEFIEKVRQLSLDRESFDPMTSKRSFNIIALDFFVQTLMSGFVSNLRETNKNITLACSFPKLENVTASLKNKEYDLAIAVLRDVPNDFYISTLCNIDRVCIASANHPDIQGDITLQQYVSNDHVGLSPGYGDTPSVTDKLIDDVLMEGGMTRHMALWLPGILAVPSIVEKSDLIGTVSRPFAEEVSKTMNIQVLELPFLLPASPVSLIWHAQMHNDAGHRWLRKAIRSWSGAAALNVDPRASTVPAEQVAVG